MVPDYIGGGYMLLVDETLVSDIARGNKKIARLASRHGMEMDSDISALVSRGVNKESLFKEISDFSEETENEDLI